jgi:hypothetical protein
MNLIHSEKMRNEILDRLEGDNDEKALADLTLSIVKQLDMSAKGVQKPIGDEVKWKGASVFMEQLVDVGTQAGVIDIDQEGIKRAAGDAVGRYMKEGIANGTITEDQMREAYKIIKTKNPDKQVMFDPAGTPGVEKSPTKIPITSPGPVIQQGAGVLRGK